MEFYPFEGEESSWAMEIGWDTKPKRLNRTLYDILFIRADRLFLPTPPKRTYETAIENKLSEINSRGL